MKLENIKTALRARAASLNLNPQEATVPAVVDVPVSSTPVVPVVTPKPAATKNGGKTSPQIPLLNTAPVVPQPDKTVVKTKPSVNTDTAQSQPAVSGDKAKAPDKVANTPTGNAPKISVEKPARKPATRKAKEPPAPVVPAPVVQSDDIEAIVAKYLKAGRDYDRLPNTTKPTLLKSGAEILAGIFGFRTTAKVINRVADYEKQFVLYEVQVTVLDKDGNIAAEGLGSCNSRERKYLKTDFATNLNTVLKIAKKRAFVDAILTATHASKVFTQDIEDIVSLQVVTDNRVEPIK